ncbi:MAG: hypothetical protein COB30_014205 [Ectothiorhodospiraceae bacterium]|nr:hypothetical protein [Ectothiorhodospiraceae bacterium]
MSKFSVRLLFVIAVFFSLPVLALADDALSPSGDRQTQLIQKQTLQLEALQKQVLRLQAEKKAAAEQDSASVIRSFASDKSAKSELVAIDDKTKHIVMFSLGVPLLLFLLATASFGIAMGVYGKPVFVPHMVCAGFSVSLALGHAVVGIVWFYPF